MRGDGLRTAGAALAVVLAVGLGAGGRKKHMEAVSTALQNPRVRTGVIPKQHGDLTIAVPPCSEASVTQSGSSKIPPGSHTDVVPSGTLTQSVAVQPRPPPESSSSSSGGSSGGSSSSQSQPPPPSTILLTPG